MKLTPRSTLLVAGLCLVLGTLLGRFVFAPAHPPAMPAEAGEAVAEAAPTIWTCSMHPQIQQPEEGDCPICGMDLTPVDEGAGAGGGPRQLVMSEAALALAEVRTTTVERRFPEIEMRLVGKLAIDETRERTLSARFPARIERLFVNYTGIRVAAGEHLAEVFSPELLTTQHELLSAHRLDPSGTFTRAAREKLRLWDLLPEQIEAILEEGVASDHFELKAPTGGVVIEKHVQEGDYVQTGQRLFRIADLDVLWLHLQAFESDLPWLRYGQELEFTVEAHPGRTFAGTIAFIDPQVDRRTRTIAVRVNVPNPDGRLKPGMLARATVEVRLAENGRVHAPALAGKWISPMHPEIVKDGPGSCDVCGMDLVPAESLGFLEDADAEGAAPLVVPVSAVLRTGKRGLVYVRLPDADAPTFEGREVVLGPRAGEYFVIAEGLEAGESVVTRGAFKIDSALQIQAKPSMMSQPGETPGDGSAGAPALTLAAEDLPALLPPYFATQDALAADDLATAKEALHDLLAVAGHHGPLPDLLHEMLRAENLDTLRRPHFETLSNALIATLEAHPEARGGLAVYHMTCPMVYPDRGADWLQNHPALLNPYFGAMMLRCGETTTVFEGAQDGTGDEGRGSREVAP
jgi:membrane fusion protein, copper/silver efflux system